MGCERSATYALRSTDVVSGIRAREPRFMKYPIIPLALIALVVGTAGGVLGLLPRFRPQRRRTRSRRPASCATLRLCEKSRSHSGIG